MGLGEIRLGEMGLGEMGQNRSSLICRPTLSLRSLKRVFVKPVGQLDNVTDCRCSGLWRYQVNGLVQTRASATPHRQTRPITVATTKAIKLKLGVT